MARHHPHRTKRKASATKQDSGAPTSPHSACDAGRGEPCESFVVTDDFPTEIAISPRELDVIEAFLGTLDNLLN